MASDQIHSALELNGPKLINGLMANNGPDTPNTYFQKLFPAHHAQFGPAFLELREIDRAGFTKVTPISINIDFFASVLSDPNLKLSVVYFEPEMQFYYLEPFQHLYKPVSGEKLQALYRGLLLRCAQSLNCETNILNLFVEFRSDKTAKSVVQRAKSILAADSSFFSAESAHARIRGIELHERLARKFVEELMAVESGKILMLGDAYIAFSRLLKERELAPVKRSDFKAMVAPIIKDELNISLRNDLVVDERQGVRGWKGVKLLQTAPG